MKFKKVLLILTCLLACIGCACSTAQSFEGQVKVTFNLEGGIYQNCERPIVHYYDFTKDSTGYIVDPETLSQNQILKSGYSIEGWYKTKTVQGESVTYSDKWDFENDKVGSEGVTLYANWVKDIVYSYNVCYYNDSNEIVVLGTYPVNPGEPFEDYANFAKKRTDGIYTPLAFVDENGDPWQEDFTHPGGEQSLAINVFVQYIKGNFKLVSTAKELKGATGDNIYLLNDIDMQGEEISFAGYSKQFVGNGHTISNFKISYDASKNSLVEDFEDSSRKSLCISLFGNAKGASVSDVNFTNVVIEINTTLTLTYKIYLAPLGMSVTNGTFENVNMDCTYSVLKLPADKTEEMIVVSDSAIYKADEKTVINNVTATLTKLSNDQ